MTNKRDSIYLSDKSVAFYILTIGFVILGLGVLDTFSESPFVDPIEYRLILGMLGITSFLGFLTNDWFRKNIRIIFFFLLGLANLWLYYLCIENQFPSRYVYSLIASIFANSFIFSKKLNLYIYLAVSTLVFFSFRYFYNSDTVELVTPLYLILLVSITLVVINRINVNNDLVMKTNEIKRIKNQLLGLDIAIEENNNAVIFTDSDGLIKNANKVFFKNHNYKELIKDLNYLDHLRDKLVKQSSIKHPVKILREGISKTFETKIKSPDGEFHWLEIKFTRINEEETDIDYVIIENEITKEKNYKIDLEDALVKLEENNFDLQNSIYQYKDALKEISLRDKKLSESENQLKSVLNANPDIIFIQDYDGVYLDVFTQDTSQLIIPKHEFINKKMVDVLPKNLYDIIIEPFEKAKVSDAIQSVVYNVPIDNQLQYFEARLTKYSDNKILTIIRNVSQEENLKSELIEQTNFINKIAETSPNYIYVINLFDYQINYKNRNLQNLYGYTEFHINNLEKGIFSLISEHDLEEFLFEIERLIKEEDYQKTVELTYKIENSKDTRYIRSLAKLFKIDLKNNLKQVLFISEDITDDIKNKNLIERAEQKWKFAIEGSGDGLWDWDIENNVVYYSENWKKMLGYDNSEIKNDFSEWERLVHKDDLQGAKESLDKYLKGLNDEFIYEHRMLTKHDGYKWILTRGKIIERTENKDPKRIIGIHNDINDRILQAREIKSSQERFQRLIENISGIFWIKNINKNKILYISPNYETIWGRSLEDIYEDAEDFVENIHPDDRARVFEAYKKIFDGKDFDETYRLLVEDEIKWVRVRTKLVKNDKDELFDYGYAEEITKEVTYQEELLKRTDELQLSQQMAKIGGWSVDLIEMSVYWSEEVRIIHEAPVGYKPSLEEGINFYIDEHRPIISEAVSEAIEKGKTWDLELKIRTYKNNIKWIRTIGKVIKKDEKAIQIKGTFQDIDEKKRAQEEQSRIFELSIDMICVANFDGYFTQLNSAWEETLGFTIEELTSKPYLDFVHPDDLENTTKAAENLKGNNNVISFENRYLTKSGTYKWLSWNSLPIVEEGVIYAIVRDISRDKEQERKLKESATQLELAQKMAKLGSWKADLIKEELFWSDEVKMIHEVDLDYKPSLVEGINFYAPEHREIISKAVQNGIDNQKSWDLELQIITTTGKRKWVRAIGQPILEGDKIIGLIGTFQDIDDQKRTQEEKNKIFDLSIDMICVAGFDGYFKQLNSAWSSVLGWSNYELKSKPFIEFIHEKDKKKTELVIEKLANGEKLVSFENRIKTKHGTYRWLSWNALPSLEENLMYAISRDITEEKNRNKELLIAKEAAESANYAKSSFLANMSHEIRTPMNAILGFGELLYEELENSEQIQFVQSILNSGKNLLTLINDILDLSKIEAGKLDIKKEKIDLFEFLSEIKQIFTLKASEKNLLVELNIKGDLPKIIETDEIRLRQILFNLLGNAIKFTEEGQITIRVSALQNSVNNHTIIIEIIDTGIGIPESQQKKIFNAFTQQDEQSTRKYGGTGLGLTITKKLIDILNGQIQLSSKPGDGSNFTVVLNNLKTYKHQFESNTDTLSKNVKFKLGKILIVEDLETNYTLLKSILNKFGSPEIFWANNGLEAIKSLDDFKPDIIFMDIQMPVMDGIEATTKIKEKEKFYNIPIVALTALAMKSNVDNYKKYFDGYLTKPIIREELIKILNKFFEVEKNIPESIGTDFSLTKQELDFIKNNEQSLKRITETFEFDSTIETLSKISEKIPKEGNLDKKIDELIDLTEGFDIDSLNKEINELIKLSKS